MWDRRLPDIKKVMRDLDCHPARDSIDIHIAPDSMTGIVECTRTLDMKGFTSAVIFVQGVASLNQFAIMTTLRMIDGVGTMSPFGTVIFYIIRKAGVS